MNRIDRLFGILLILQNQPRVRAQDLAERFEVSKRTVYRDITALSEMGVPIVSLPGEGYELMEGFYLPPLIFTDDEAIALFLGARLLIQQAAGALTVKAEQALAKIAVALPQETRQRVEALTAIIVSLLKIALIWMNRNSLLCNKLFSSSGSLISVITATIEMKRPNETWNLINYFSPRGPGTWAGIAVSTGLQSELISQQSGFIKRELVKADGQI